MFPNSYRYFQVNSGVSKLITILSYVSKPTIISKLVTRFYDTTLRRKCCHQHPKIVIYTFCHQHLLFIKSNKYFLDITSALMHLQEFGDFKIHIPIKNLRSEPFSLKYYKQSQWNKSALSTPPVAIIFLIFSFNFSPLGAR